MKLHVLLDVDGTLLETNGIGVEPFSTAVRIATGEIPNFDRNAFRGQTDHVIARTLLQEKKIENEEAVEEVLRIYETGLETTLGVGKVTALPGVKEAIVALSHIPDVFVSIATGNTERALDAKLRSAQLHNIVSSRFFSTNKDKSRTDILTRASHYLNVNKVLVIGDTFRDAQSAADIGAIFGAVTSKHYHDDEANADGARFLIPHPWNTDTLVGLVRKLGIFEISSKKSTIEI